jgi:coenzyme F420-reducing hydrogenase gamma subunit
VHAFSSCGGCQAVLLDEALLLDLAARFEVMHFAQLGPQAPDAAVDIALVEGSVSTPEDVARLQRLRAASRYLVALGNCATSGGLQSLRGLAPDGRQWVADLYPHPEWLELLESPTPLERHVRVDLALWGCPVDARQLARLLSERLAGVAAQHERRPLCMECKAAALPCLQVTRGEPCLGPVTRAGCGALCPRHGRACYGCFGPANFANVAALAERCKGLGAGTDGIVRRLRFVAGAAPAFCGGAAGAQAGGPETP